MNKSESKQAIGIAIHMTDFDPVPAIVRGILDEKKREELKNLEFIVNIDPEVDTVMYCCLVDPAIFKGEVTHRLYPGIIGLPSFCGVPGLEDFIDCGKDLECFYALATSRKGDQPGFYSTALHTDPLLGLEEGKIYKGLYTSSLLRSGVDYRDATVDEIVEYFKSLNPKKWKRIKPVERIEIPGQEEFEKKLSQIIVPSKSKS